jgi:hypothetical protein
MEHQPGFKTIKHILLNPVNCRDKNKARCLLESVYAYLPVLSIMKQKTNTGGDEFHKEKAG